MNEFISNSGANIFFYHGLVLFGALLIAIVLIHMLYNRRSPNSITAWLLSIILIPYISVFLYFIIGSRKREKRYKKDNLVLKNKITNSNIQNSIDKMLRNYGIADAAKNSEFKLFFDAKQAYSELLSNIQNAKKSIFLSIYIFKYDKVGKEILNALIKKAQEGLDVKILIDSLGSFPLYLLQYKLKELKNSGADVEFFMPVFRMPFRNYINLRNHRKIYIFDNEKVLSGGGNLSKEYLGTKSDKKRWQDIMFFIQGASVEHFFEVFASDWHYASMEKLEYQKEYIESAGDIYLQVVPSGPDMDRDVFYEVLLSMIYGAKEKIYIITPYYIPNEALTQALIIAHHKGVEINLITPKETNHIIVNLVRSSYMRELEESGIKIFLNNGAMLHAKAIIIDDKSVILGSVNFDNRSLFLNYEIATFIYSQKVIKEVEQWAQKLILDSSFGTKNVSKPRRIFENLLRILAPQL
ncbi:cardiolipin synthase [Sulfurimonas sp.]|jgi:cardiolipin synthase|uniref:cardiolipin synthase n=1 Tax=Sulfurimonas sp. TaxID=2022749 RepID=UPI0025D0E028|nr:cardiolipin synthase [Sulfurimonas sp.]MCK9474060.1 cardiolipin synthase [Sulfurimonas sp.]MDD3505911.1 cardiolipin synthase [Sulfurimonas sp.]